jgi:SAM-dependent methyltransferase
VASNGASLDKSPGQLLAEAPRLRFAIAALGPVDGLAVLDVACGTGVSSVILAEAGARVTGCDVSCRSIEAAAERCRRLGMGDRCRFECGPVEELDARGEYDALFGSFALHHLDLAAALPALARALKARGRYAFLETSASNRVLMFGRAHLAGRLGIPRYGSRDEHPLRTESLGSIAAHLGPMRLHYPDFACFQIAGRYLGAPLGMPSALGGLGASLDRALDRSLPVRRWTYWVVVCSRD